MQTITIIAAVAQNNVIGKDNQLIWRLPADLKHFKQMTLGHSIVMGRKTFDSIGKPLPGRTSVIVTRDRSYTQDHCMIVYSLEEAIQALKDQDEIFIIGGAEIYKQSMPLATRLSITQVNASFDGDAFFPEINLTEWLEEGRLDFEADEKNAIPYSFVTYIRK